MSCDKPHRMNPDTGLSRRTDRCTLVSTTTPTDAPDVARYPKVLVPELNLGQLSRLVRADFLVDARSVTKVQGLPFTAGELERAILETLEGDR